MNFLRYPSSDQRLLCSDEALSPERVGPLDELSTIARAAKEEKTASLKISCSSRCLKFSGKLPDVPMKLDAKRKKKEKHKICGQQKKKRQRCCCGTVAMVRIAGHSQRA